MDKNKVARFLVHPVSVDENRKTKCRTRIWTHYCLAQYFTVNTNISSVRKKVA